MTMPEDRCKRCASSMRPNPTGEHVMGCRPPELEAFELAAFMHENYERMAPRFGYKTRAESAVPWDEVPINNRLLMKEVARRVVVRVGADRKKIKEAAVRLDGKLYTGKRHGEIIQKIAAESADRVLIRQPDQGFVTEDGQFVTRVEAAEIAFRAGQIEQDLRGQPLMSEDLY